MRVLAEGGMRVPLGAWRVYVHAMLRTQVFWSGDYNGFQ